MKEIKEENIQILWHLGYYDGYLSAIGKYDDQYVFIKCLTENDEYFQELMENEEDEEYVPKSWWRQYGVFILSDLEVEFEIRKHKDFESFVGQHTNYQNNKRIFGSLRPQSEWSLFYTKYQGIKTDYSQNLQIAYYYK